MSLPEIEELLRLKQWGRGDLASRLGRCRNTIDRWFSRKPSQRLVPGVAECLVMRQWLNEARDEAMSRWKADKQPQTA